ncbi:sulfatase [Mariniflexile sp. HNIBRBA6329]|uniref:sulfatase n=1 Tax=Mariniflexile sp. HNIBRBA6329 TaxID=3373088 RepID=UPI00374632C0
MKSILKLNLVAFFSVLLLSCHFKEEKVSNLNKPNVLFLYMDDLRPELACYGKTQLISPNIDDLASHGIIFDNAYCNVPVCGASRASMLTGMLPTKSRFLNYNSFVEQETPNAVTLPQLFKNNGYITISNGKVYHHLDDRETDWDEVWRPYAFDKNDKGLAPTDYWQSLWRDYQLPENIKLYKETGTGPAYEKADVNDSIYIDGLMAQKVIRDLKKLKQKKQPFFLTAGFIANHLPFNAPKKYWDLYPTESIKQPYNNFIPKNAPSQSVCGSPELRQYAFIPNEGQVTDSVAKELIHGYYATVSYVDALIGEILTTLRTLELDKNTIVILVSDHGYNLQEHTEWAKFTNHRTSAKVPLLINLPNNKAKNKTTDALVELVDIYPTLADLCNLKIPENQLDGKSLVSIIDNPSLKGKESVLIKRLNGYTIKTSKYAYTEYINEKNNTVMQKMLFDHVQDPDENTNVANEPEYAHIVKMLSNTLRNQYGKNMND